MISVQNLNKTFTLTRQQRKELNTDLKTAIAVKELNLSCQPGRVFSLLGPNGAGKTTTLRMIATLLAPTSGQIHINGINALTNPQEARKHIGFLTGSTGLYARHRCFHRRKRTRHARNASDCTCCPMENTNWKNACGYLFRHARSKLLAHWALYFRWVFRSLRKSNHFECYTWYFNTLFYRFITCTFIATCCFLCGRHGSNCYLRQKLQGSAEHHYTTEYCHDFTGNGWVFSWHRTQPQNNAYSGC